MVGTIAETAWISITAITTVIGTLIAFVAFTRDVKFKNEERMKTADLELKAWTMEHLKIVEDKIDAKIENVEDDVNRHENNFVKIDETLQKMNNLMINLPLQIINALKKQK